MTTGKQLAGMLLLTTALTLPNLAYAQDTGGAPGAAGAANSTLATVPQDDELEQVEGVDGAQDEFDDPDISVPGGAIIVTGRINRDPTRNSTQVISVLSSEQIARTGEGDIAGALGRVTGLSVVGNGLVFVRGLGDRYSLALLNGLPLPSPEPLSRVVPLDIFPTNVVASSLVQKTYSANFPGEFGGGVINLTTQAVPDESFVKISGGLSGDTKTTGAEGLSYFGGAYDWTGFDNGARDIPAPLQNFFDQSLSEGVSVSDEGFDQEALARSLTRGQFASLQQLGAVPVNFSLGITAGTGIDVGDTGRLGLLLTGGLSNKWRNRLITRQTAGPNSTDYRTNYRDFITDNSVLANAMLGVGYEFGDHTIRATGLFIRDTVKQASLENGVEPSLNPGFEYSNQNTSWFERQLIDGQLVGEFDFGGLGVDVRAGYAQTQREAPFNLTYNYGRTNLENDPFGDYFRVSFDQEAGLQDTVTASFSDLKEDLWYGGLDLSYELMLDLTATVGYAYTDTDRTSQRREFQLIAGLDPNALPPEANPNDVPNGGIPIEVLRAIGLRSAGLLFNDTLFNLFDVGLIDRNELDPAFGAELTIHAGYGQFQWLAADTLTLQAGVRYETADQTTTPLGLLNQAQTVTKSNDYFLPGATITYEPIDSLQLRASASRTIARPQFRELVNQRYDDPETNRSYRGNPFLTDSELLNLEGRAEYYLGGQSRISLAGFYKKIDRPIEVFISPQAGSGTRIINYANAPTAQLYGAELEAQYTHDLYDLGGFFETKALVLVANYTYTKSEIQVQDDDISTIVVNQQSIGTPSSLLFNDGAPLVGQSDHLVNGQIGFEDIENLQQFTVLFNYASDRVAIRGSNGLQDVIEKPGISIDVVVRQGFNIANTEAELKLEARNIFGNDHEEYQINSTGLRIDNNTYSVGPSFGASLSVTF